ncbi:putative transcriptional regulator [Methanohalophilus levihalophilus]|uniref:winged helix-turn-helix transcriptional regulator n=1 Tax=Methanohalophilus levihalophilus TaxID=1431282 RepID=UPI001AE9C02E|nr:winged helix-turn-helix transcriptional regulator [Methanohalophilus levihalophilus]MBP2029606.1 putative transcriptional regulator [Methanohalophilus levihalophilus]
MSKLLISLLFFLFVCSPVLVNASEYEIVPYTGPERGLYEGGGADANLSFFELPLSLQIVYISGLLGISFAFYKFLPLFLGRIKKYNGNQNRNRILCYITMNPGSTITDIEKDMGLNRSSVRYHVRTLQLSNKITHAKKGKFTLLFKKSSKYTDTEKKIAHAMRNSTRKSILLSIIQKPGMTNQEITQTFNLDKSTVHWHISDMHNEGIIDFESDGKYKRYFINPSIRENVENALYIKT